MSGSRVGRKRIPKPLQGWSWPQPSAHDGCPVAACNQGRASGRGNHGMKAWKQGVSTIDRTRLGRKPGQANRFGDGCAGNGTVSINGFGLTEYHRHEWGMWVTKLAGGPATEPDKRLAPWLHGVPAYGAMQHGVLTRYLFATDGSGRYV